jgi:hypothetical protein
VEEAIEGVDILLDNRGPQVQVVRVEVQNLHPFRDDDDDDDDDDDSAATTTKPAWSAH